MSVWMQIIIEGGVVSVCLICQMSESGVCVCVFILIMNDGHDCHGSMFVIYNVISTQEK